MDLIKVENVDLGYDNHVVVKNLSFNIAEGDYLCVVGENGSGKSTLMKTLLGLNSTLKGKIEFAANFKKNGIGYLPQQTEVQKDFPAAVEEIVLSGFQGKSKGFFYSNEEKNMAKDKMQKMGILDLAKQSYRALSGGQQQLVLLARALCALDQLLILDEPVAGLDPKVAQELYEIIKKLNTEGVTIIMVTHDVNTALKYANKILHIGKSIFFGLTEEYVNSETGKHFKDYVGGCENG